MRGILWLLRPRLMDRGEGLASQLSSFSAAGVEPAWVRMPVIPTSENSNSEK